MNFKELHELPDKMPVTSVFGTIEKIYPPADQNDKDKEWGQHRQSILLHDDSGEKLMITLMKSAIHILDNVEGARIELTSTDKEGETRGLILNRWRKADSEYDKVVLKVYPEAKIRVTDQGRGTVATPDTGNDSRAAAAPSGEEPTAVSEFEHTVALSSRGYQICIAESERIVAKFPSLGLDSNASENIRVIATSLWMDSKHKVQTLASPAVARNPKPEPTPAAAVSEPAAATLVEEVPIAARLAKGFRMDSEKKLGDKAIDLLESLATQADLIPVYWADAYTETLKLWGEELMGLFSLDRKALMSAIIDTFNVYVDAAADNGIKDHGAAEIHCKRQIVRDQKGWVATIGSVIAASK